MPAAGYLDISNSTRAAIILGWSRCIFKVKMSPYSDRTSIRFPCRTAPVGAVTTRRKWHADLNYSRVPTSGDASNHVEVGRRGAVLECKDIFSFLD